MQNTILIKNCYLTTFFNDGYNATKILENMDILISGNRIVKIDRKIDEKADIVIDGTGKLAAPGFVNGRSCSVAAMMSKSVTSDIKCSRFGNTARYIRTNPLVNIAQDALSDEQLKALLRLSVYENIESGATTVLEQCSNRELPLFLEVCEELGLRSIACPTLMSRDKLPETDAWGVCDNALQEIDEDALVNWNAEMVKKSEGKLAHAGIGIGSVETVTESLVRKAANKAFELNCRVMLPLNETEQEREVCLQRYGMLPAQFFHKNHMLHRFTIAGGNQYTDKTERTVLRSGKTAAALCPMESLHNAVVTPFLDFQYDGLNILIGSGNATPNMAEQIRTLTLSGKLERGLRHQMRAQKSFFAVTTGGAQAAEISVGELDEGLIADLILVDVKRPHFHPFSMPIDDLIYNTWPSDISEVIIDGRIVKSAGTVVGIDVASMVEKAEEAMNVVWMRAHELGVL